ncbi:hypothetical protein [Streptosporangium sp. NPDC000396]|uniref:hypothetical protein n=1 Tax=Streptosporangium sp. NPDC000396 TaxID=3366185 RepID=UPI0036D186DE
MVLNTSPRQRASGLPVEVTDFAGRRQGVAEAGSILSGARAVILIGVGGIGGTRFADDRLVRRRGHVERILSELGLTSRARIAAGVGG